MLGIIYLDCYGVLMLLLIFKEIWIIFREIWIYPELDFAFFVEEDHFLGYGE